ncbi:MAG TPA: hypothetical protein PKB10_04000, partial [Tepidisphaeraceae bacterium]|nr:hypothetical protein [Tepidisphaeraceae bacterium]
HGEIPYDERARVDGDERKIDGHEYTLENLLKVGGICIDQSYFASQVARIVGVPSVVVIGQGGGGGVGHAWVGSLELRGRQVLWNFTDGRYDAQLYYTGTVTDPQTRRSMSEGQVAMLAELHGVAPAARHASVAIFHAHDLAPVQARAGWLMRAIELSPANHAAWLALADLGATRQLDPRDMQRVAETTRNFARGPYADVAFAIFSKLISGLSNDEQIREFDTLRKIFTDRKDLYAATRVAQGRLLKTLSRDKEALAALGDVLTNHLYAGPIVLDALSVVEELLLPRQPQRLLAIYQQTLANTPRPSISAYAQQSSYVRIGMRYVELLRAHGDERRAAIVEALIY